MEGKESLYPSSIVNRWRLLPSFFTAKKQQKKSIWLHKEWGPSKHKRKEGAPERNFWDRLNGKGEGRGGRNISACIKYAAVHSTVQDFLGRSNNGEAISTRKSVPTYSACFIRAFPYTCTIFLGENTVQA